MAKAVKRAEHHAEHFEGGHQAKQPHPKSAGGEFEKSAHKGAGKSEQLEPPAVGTGYRKATPNASKAPMGGKGYETSAHSEMHHEGEAVGAKREAAPMDYDRKTHAEGGKSEPVAGYDDSARGNPVGMAEHHVGTGHGGEPHQFPKASGAHSFGHPAHVRSGHLRNSGHSGAHRIGKK